MKRFVYVFLDGVGLAEASETNPFTPYYTEITRSNIPPSNLEISTIEPDRLVQPTPGLFKLLGAPLLAGLHVEQTQLLLKSIDATLGVAGRPQSATGQTSLYTGRNAPAFLGRHLTGFANGSLRTLIEESGIFKQVLSLNGSATLANLYAPGYFEAIEQGRIRYAVGTLLALTAGVPFRTPTDLERGEAINWDITNRYLGQRGVAAPIISPEIAGERLANLSQDHNLTLFECFLPDYAGHDQNLEQAREVIAIVDTFLSSLFNSIDPTVTVVVCSDHGNIEDLSKKIHTFNPVPLLVKGPDAPAFTSVENITQITPVIVSLLKSSII